MMLFGSSVELFVYLREGCGMTYVQINNTPHRIEYIENDICLYTVMSVALSLHIENFHIFSQGLAKHFH